MFIRGSLNVWVFTYCFNFIGRDVCCLMLVRGGFSRVWLWFIWIFRVSFWGGTFPHILYRIFIGHWWVWSGTVWWHFLIWRWFNVLGWRFKFWAERFSGLCWRVFFIGLWAGSLCLRVLFREILLMTRGGAVGFLVGGFWFRVVGFGIRVVGILFRVGSFLFKVGSFWFRGSGVSLGWVGGGWVVFRGNEF